MKRSSLVLTAVIVGFLAVGTATRAQQPAAAGSACTCCCAATPQNEPCCEAIAPCLRQGGDSCYAWDVTAGVTILHRSPARRATLVRDGLSDGEIINVNDFQLDYAAGPSFEITRRFACGWDFDVRYFGIDGWNTTHALDDPSGNLHVPLVSSSPSDFFETASARYASRLYSTEFNVARRCGDRLRLLAGFRWVELHELIAAEVWSPDLRGSLGYHTGNSLFGFQLGAEGRLWQPCAPLHIDGFIKAGVYDNRMRLSGSGEGTNFDLNGSITYNRCSFLGECGLTATYRLSDHFSIYGGYEAMWLEGVALAGDVVAAFASGNGDIVQNGTAFYHGAIAGVQCTW